MLWLLLLIICPLAMLLMMRGMHHEDEDHQQTHPPSALEILEQRFARGEISREEFQQRREALMQEGRHAV